MDAHEWGRLVAASPDGTVYSLPKYLDALCGAAGGRWETLGIRYGGELVGGVALYEQDSRRGVHVSPRWLLSFNGIVLRRFGTKYPSQQTARHVKIMSSLADAVAGRGYSRVTLNCWCSVSDLRPFLAAGWTASPFYTYVVPIADLDALWSRIEQNLRRLISRCENDGMAVREDDDFDSFYRMHSSTMRRKGRLPYLPESAFRRFFRSVRDADLCRLFHALLPDGRPIATQLVLLGPNGVSHTVTAASEPDFLQTGVNAFLRWKSFTILSGMGFAANDLTGGGLTRVGHFKSQLGGDLRLFLVLNSPRSFRQRAWDGAESLVRKGKTVLRTALRRSGTGES